MSPYPKNEEEEVEEVNNEEEEEVDVLDELDLPAVVLKRVRALRKQHEEYEAIEAEYKKARLELEKQFAVRKQVLYNQRGLIVKGDVDVADEEGAAAPTESDEKGIPSFWLTVLSAHPEIGNLITEEDVPALESLVNITSELNEDYSEFDIIFHFAENDFFTNTVLTKKYYVSPDLLDEKAPALMKIDGCEINWKAGKNLCVKEITKKQKAKGGRNKGQVRTITKSVPSPSFFHYFDERSDEDEDDEEEEGKDDENENGPIKLSLDEDYDIGHTIRTALIPEAILFFTGEAMEMEDDYFGEEDDEDEDDDEDNEDDDEEEEEEDNKKAAGKNNKKNQNKGGAGGAVPPTGEQPPECKQN